MPRYTEEFKREAVRLYRTSGRTQHEVAAGLGITANTLRSWVRRDEESSSVLELAEREELRRLRKENAVLQEENEILKKAAAFFARENLPRS